MADDRAIAKVKQANRAKMASGRTQFFEILRPQPEPDRVAFVQALYLGFGLVHNVGRIVVGDARLPGQGRNGIGVEALVLQNTPPDRIAHEFAVNHGCLVRGFHLRAEFCSFRRS